MASSDLPSNVRKVASRVTSLTRRDFLLTTSYVGAGLAVTGALPLASSASAEPVELAPYKTGLRMAATPATAYRAYRSKVVATPEVTTWVQPGPRVAGFALVKCAS